MNTYKKIVENIKIIILNIYFKIGFFVIGFIITYLTTGKFHIIFRISSMIIFIGVSYLVFNKRKVFNESDELCRY